MGIWRAKRPDQPKNSGMTAAAGAVTRQHLNSATRPGTVQAPWQSEIDMYDEWGPGFIGTYLDLISDKVAKCDAILGKDGIAVDDPVMRAVWNGVWRTWRGRYDDRADLLRSHARLRLKHGECYVLQLEDGTFVIAHRSQLEWETRYVKYIDPVTEKTERIPLIGRRVWRSWSQLDRDPRQPTCDLKRALPHVREYINVKLRQDTDTTSPLVRNKILLFGADTELYEGDNENDPYNGMPDAFVDFINLSRKRDVTPYHHKRRGVDTVPFPMLGDKIETVDLGRNSDPLSMELENAAIDAFARSVRTPAQYIKSGPGVAKFENEDFVLEALITDAVEPTSKAILADIWRVVMREQFIRAYAAVARVSIAEAEHKMRGLQLIPDTDLIRSKIDNASNLMEGYRLGAVKREQIADALDSTVLDLPEDMTEFDLWKLIAGAKDKEEAPAAGPAPTPPKEEKEKPALTAVADDFSGSIMVALYPIDGTASWSKAKPPHLTLVYSGDTGSSNVRKEDLLDTAKRIADAYAPLVVNVQGTGRLGEDGEATVALLESTPELLAMRALLAHFNRSQYTGFIPHVTVNYNGEPADKIPSVVAFDAIAVHYGKDTTVYPLRPLPAVTAAPAQPTEDTEVLDEASRVDLSIYAGLIASSQLAFQSAIDNAARRLSRLAPSGSDFKKRLAAAPTSADKLAVVTQADIDEYGITPEMLVDDSEFSQLENRAAQDLESSLMAYGAAVALIASGRRPSYRPKDGATALADGMRAYTRYRIGSGGQTVDPNGEIPNHHVRKAMSIAGGQSPDATILAGAASGVSTHETLTAAGMSLSFQWRHGYYRKPMQPDPAHVALDGIVASSVDDFNSKFPGDHIGCTCAVRMILT